MIKINLHFLKSSTIFLGLFLQLMSSCGTPKAFTTSSKPRVTTTPRKPNSNPIVTTKPTKNTEASQTLEATSTIKVTPQNVQEYIQTYKVVVQNNMHEHQIPASIIMAQGILESGIGKGKLAKEANNHFGIKCHKEWTGDVIYHDDDKAGECFRKYKDASESYRDHALFLTSRSRYDFLFTLEKDDYKGWANGLRNSGYATDPKYPEKLIGLIERYELFLLDEEVLENTKEDVAYEEKKPMENNETSQNKIEIRQNTPPVLEKVQPTKTNQDFHIVEVGQTLYSISRLYQLNTDDLMKINQLTTTNLSVGQKILVKKTENIEAIVSEIDENKTHLVSAGDTLYNISKRYGLTLDQLKALNQLQDNNISLGQFLIIK